MASGSPHAFVQRTIRWLTELSRLYVVDADMESRLRIVVAELTENVGKYATGGKATVSVTIEQRDEQVYVRVETSNSAPERDIERAVALLSQIRDANDRVFYYDQLVKSVAPTRVPGVSGLGIARIAAEGQLGLDYRVEGDVLTIRVETPIGAVGGA